MTLIRDLIEIPTQVQDGDFVLKLSQGINDTRDTVDKYVVTDQLAEAFDQALGLVASAVKDNQSKAVYLHGSFGAGKSHFMAILHLLLSHDMHALSKPELHPAISAWGPHLGKKQFLLVPVHFLGAQSMEQKILGGYVETVQARHPGAALPAVYLGDAIVATELPAMRRRIGDELFLAGLNETASSHDEWGDFGQSWTVDELDEALDAPATDPRRQNLVAAYIAAYRQGSVLESATSGKGFVDLDRGLAAISTHAQTLGYAGVVLFLDELILWLASNIGDLGFVQSESQKLTKLVEATDAGRPVPIVSFVARQRDLRELVGDHIAGNEEVALADNLELQQGRFGRIELASGNLPAVAKERLLKPRDDAAAAQLRSAVDQALAGREDVRHTLLGSEADLELFRLVYPFSPTLVRALVDVSEALQRERTALKVMLQLLVDQRDSLEVGQIIPVGDLWDVVAGRDEPFSSELKHLFETAKRLWRTKLYPALQQINNVTDATADDAPERRSLANDARLVKTVLLAALVPEVEAFKNLTASRLAALNWGTVRSPISGNETQIVANKLNRLGALAGELMVGHDPINPTVTLRLANVDTEEIVTRAAESYDSPAARRSKVRELISRSLGDRIGSEIRSKLQVSWRGTIRDVDVVFGNVRDTTEVPDALLVADPDRPKLVIDFPFDQTGRSPEDDLERLDAWAERHDPTTTVCWLPSFLNADGLVALKRYVAVDELLKLDRFEQNTAHLSATQRVEAKPILESLRNQLAAQLRDAVLVAYGVIGTTNALVDTAHALVDHYRSLDPALVIRPTTKPTLEAAMDELCTQIFDNLFPGHPRFESEVKAAGLRATWAVVQRALADTIGRATLEPTQRAAVRNVATALQLGPTGDSHLTLGDFWRTQLDRHLSEARSTGTRATVSDMRRWIDAVPGGPRGLEPQVADLVTLTVAAQTDHRLMEHGVTYQADAGRALPGDVELVPEVLPDAATWTAAVKRAATVFGVTVHDRVTGPELASLEAQVRQKVTGLIGPATELASRLDEAYLAWGLADGNRVATARAARDLLATLNRADDSVAETLAAFAAPVSDAATAKSMTSATVVAAAVGRANLRLWGTARAVVGQRATAALQADELVIQFEREATEIEAKATEYVTRSATPPATPPVTPVPPGKARQVRTAAELASVVDELRRDVNERGPLTVSWTFNADESRRPEGGS